MLAAILNVPSCFKDLVLKMYLRVAYSHSFDSSREWGFHEKV